MLDRKTLSRFALVIFAYTVPTVARAQTAPVTPGSPGRAILKQWLDVLNGADSAGLAAFAAAHCASCKVSVWMQRSREFGAFDEVRILSAEPPRIIFAARARSAALGVRGSIQFEEGDPSQIKTFGFRSMSPSVGKAACTAYTAPGTHGVSEADVASEDAIVAALYDVISGPACQYRDWDRFRGLFAPDGRLIPKEPGDVAVFGIHAETPEEFTELARGSMESLGFFEKEVSRTGESFNGVVHRFSTYESRRTASDATPFARGINSIQLLFDGKRWWLVNVYWAAEQPGAPIPETYLKHP